jgi:hypothetical protein
MIDPRRIIQACDRLEEVLRTEFPELSPADTHFALTSLAHTHIEAFHEQVDRRFKGIEPRRGAFRTAGTITGRLPLEPQA